MVTPWTVGAVPHEVGHNLQADLGLSLALPRALRRRFAREGLPPAATRIRVRWTKEIWADLVSIPLIGPAHIGSPKDVVGRSPEEVTFFAPTAVHPVPWLRVLINLHLLGRIGFAAEAAAHRRARLAFLGDEVADDLEDLRAPIGPSVPDQGQTDVDDLGEAADRAAITAATAALRALPGAADGRTKELG